MLPLTTCLLVACNIESKFLVQRKKFRPLLVAVLIGILFTQVTVFTQQAIASQEFPSEQQDVDPQWKSMSDWIHDHTAKDAIIISHPWKLANFTWMTEGATVVKLKLFPQTKKSIVEYNASYFLTDVEHHLDLEIVHSQPPYVLYARSKS